MLHRHPLLSRALSLLILGLYLAAMYFGWQIFLASPASSTLLQPFGSSPGVSSLLSRSDRSQRLYSTKDGGQSWQQVYTDKSNYLDSITCSSTADCLVMGNNFNNSAASSYADTVVGLITANGGQTWDSVQPKINKYTGTDEQDISDTSILSCPALRTCYLLVETDTTGLAATTDGGRTWQVVNDNISKEPLDTLSCVSATICLAAGQDGLIVRTTDGGITWSVQKSGTDSSLGYLSCSASGFCLALGRSGLAVASEDSGASWTKKNSSPFKYTFRLTCVGETTCYSLGYNNSEYKLTVTRDRGANWQVLDGAPKKAINALSCPASGVCFAAGSQSEIGFTSDGGKSWSSLLVADKIWVDAISCPDKLNCFVLATPASR